MKRVKTEDAVCQYCNKGMPHVNGEGKRIYVLCHEGPTPVRQEDLNYYCSRGEWLDKNKQPLLPPIRNCVIKRKQ